MARRGRPRHPDILTPREWEVLALLRDGLSNEAIAERLDITERTARYHVSEILGKLGVPTRQAAVAWQPSDPPRWTAATAPLFLLRRLKVSWLASAAAASVAITAAAAVVVLAWGLARTSGASLDSPAVATLREFTELRAVNGVLRDHAAGDCGDVATSLEYGVPQALEFRKDPPFAGPALLLGLEAWPYEYVPEQLASPLAAGGWEVAQRPLLFRSVPGGFFLPEFFLRRLDDPEVVFRYGSDLCIQGDGQAGSKVYSGDRIDLPPSLPYVVTHRPPTNVTVEQAIAAGENGQWAGEGTRVVWAGYGNSTDFAAAEGSDHFQPLREDLEAEYWIVIIAMGDEGGPHRPDREVGTYLAIDPEHAEDRTYFCCLDLVFAD